MKSTLKKKILITTGVVVLVLAAPILNDSVFSRLTSIASDWSSSSLSAGGSCLTSPRSMSIEDVTRKKVSSMNDMSAVDVVLSDGTVCFLRLMSIVSWFCSYFFLM